MPTDQITANLPSRSFGDTAAFYARLGFGVDHRDDGWMILSRGTMEVEFFPHPDLVPADSWFSACVWVDDLDALHAAWDALGLPCDTAAIPRITPITRPSPALRMFGLIDPDGSLLRCLAHNTPEQFP